MRRGVGRAAIGLILLAIGSGQGPAPATGRREQDRPPVEPAERRLAMTPAVACSSIDGYERYVPLDEPALTKDDKLLLYFHPKHYAIEHVEDEYKARFSEDVHIRRRGQKVVLWSKDRLLGYEAKSPRPPTEIYLTNSISLKDLTPGEYDLDIILHDEVAKSPAATQVFRFRVKASPEPLPPAK